MHKMENYHNLDDVYQHSGNHKPAHRMHANYSLMILIVMTVFFIFVVISIVAIYLSQFRREHLTQINNQTGQEINVVVGVRSVAIQNDPPINWRYITPAVTVASGNSMQVYCTPGVEMQIQASYVTDFTQFPNEFNNISTAIVNYEGDNFNGTAYARYGTFRLNQLYINRDAEDSYGVSYALGYNLPITITNNYDDNVAGSSNPITENDCPTALRFPSTDNYQVCLSACTELDTPTLCCTFPSACGQTGGCESSWADQTFYTAFRDACANCLVTNCDTLPYSSPKDFDKITNYDVTFYAREGPVA